MLGRLRFCFFLFFRLTYRWFFEYTIFSIVTLIPKKKSICREE